MMGTRASEASMMSGRKPFTLYPRNSGKRTVFYYRINYPDGTRTPGRSTGKTSEGAAQTWVLNYLEEHGIGSPEGRGTFREWATDFWSETSRFVRIRRAHGHCLSAAHVAYQGGCSATTVFPG